MSNCPNQLRVHRMEYWNGNALDTMDVIVGMEFVLCRVHGMVRMFIQSQMERILH